MKKKALVSSILTIALCLSLIAGSTFALFTDSKTVNIAVTSGDVEVAASMSSFALYSAQGPVAEHSDKYLKDENNAYYEHVNPNTGYFINGGYVENDGANLEIFKITPGDRVDINIHVENTGDVAMRYRYIIKIAAGDSETLSRGMVLTTHAGKDYEGFKSFTSEWFSTVHPTQTRDHVISLELPVYANNDYQTEYTDLANGIGDIKDVKYTITVEAVQSNAVTTETETYVILYPTQSSVQGSLNHNGTVILGGETLAIEETLTAVGKDVSIADGVIDATNAEPFGSEQLALYLQDSNLTLEEGATVIAGEDFGIFGERINEVTLKKGSKIIVPQGSNAVAMYLFVLSDTFALTFEDTGLIEGNTQIVCSTAGTFNFYVPSYEAYVEYSAMIVTDGTAQSVNWMYLDGTPVNP